VLAARGAEVVMAVRDTARGEAAAKVRICLHCSTTASTHVLCSNQQPTGALIRYGGCSAAERYPLCIEDCPVAKQQQQQYSGLCRLRPAHSEFTSPSYASADIRCPLLFRAVRCLCRTSARSIPTPM
jgi:hypothetical protein